MSNLAPGRRGSLDVEGYALEYLHIGPVTGAAATFVLLHEGLGCVSMWKDFPVRLHDRTGCGVFAYSRRGYGGSSPWATPWPVAYMHHEADMLASLLATAGFDDVVLLGHSDGASIAAICQGGRSPAGVNRLILIAPHFFTEPGGLASIRQARENYEHGNLRQRLALYHGDNVDNAFYGWNGAWLHDDFVQWNIEEYLPRIRIPVQVLQGSEDPYGTVAQVKTVERNVKGPVEIDMIESCGHAPHQEKPDVVLEAIHRFVRTYHE